MIPEDFQYENLPEELKKQMLEFMQREDQDSGENIEELKKLHVLPQSEQEFLIW